MTDSLTVSFARGPSDRVPEPSFWQRWGRPVSVGLSLAILAVGAWIAAYRWGAFERAGAVGLDYRSFLIYAQRWVDTGSMYLPFQLSGPYSVNGVGHANVAMYPPNAIYLFAPFLVLPAVLWWAVPLGILARGFVRWRPAFWAWPILALLVVLPDGYISVIVGNATMWMVAFVAAGLLWGWPGLLVCLKPSLLPFALVGVRRRSWWIAALAMCALAVPLWSAWGDYVTVLRNADADATYSLGSVPAMLLPVVAWVGRNRHTAHEMLRPLRSSLTA